MDPTIGIALVFAVGYALVICIAVARDKAQRITIQRMRTDYEDLLSAYVQLANTTPRITVHSIGETPKRYPVVVFVRDIEDGERYYFIDNNDEQFAKNLLSWDNAKWLYADELLTADSGKA